MLEVCGNEDQLASVLSHEIAHCLLNHSGEKLSNELYASAILVIPLALIWAILPNDGIAFVADWFSNKVSKILMELPFSRKIEIEADELGLKLASKACYDIREASLFWAKMQVVEKMKTDFKIPEYLSTHPSNETRGKNLEKLVPHMLKLRSSCGCYKLGETDWSDQLQKFVEAMKKKQALADKNIEEKPRMQW